MELFKIPEGNGQEIYIAPDWLKAADEQYGYYYIPDDVETPGRKDRIEVLNYLLSLGYNVITDSSKVNDDTFFFTPCCDKHINKDIDEYDKKKTEKIHNSLEMTNVQEPLTLRFSDESFPKLTPNLPFVLKNEKEDGGIDKILIRTPEQLEIFKTFYEEMNDFLFQETVKDTEKRWGLSHEEAIKEISRKNYKQKLINDFVMQEFIQTPTEYNTSLRVVTSSSGDILCASIKYSEMKLDNSNKIGFLDSYLSNPESPFYLGSVSIISNTVAGGNSILIGKENYSDIEKEILQAHEIDPNNASVPKDIVEAAINIAINCRREIGAISGMDFIFDNKTKKWKYLEQQEYPMMYTYCEAYNMPYEDNVENYDAFLETQRLADIDSRLRALSLTMLKKNMIKSTEANKIIR